MSEKEEQKFQKILQKLEDSKNIGQGSWALPRNATTAEKTKYEICEKILGYQEDNNLSDEAMAPGLRITEAVSFDPNLEHQSPEYKGLYLLRGKRAKER
ncbi:9075_t:CDS:2 [Entrophospora sp. SA101]|nr:9075_t:CDS:2 [Entrophospora sp. SA101]